jgi:hypothetical protein
MVISGTILGFKSIAIKGPRSMAEIVLISVKVASSFWVLDLQRSSTLVSVYTCSLVQQGIAFWWIIQAEFSETKMCQSTATYQ